jgi:hypothetical protein
MRIGEIVWLDVIVDKIAIKHQVGTDEVEEVFDSQPRFRFVEKGKRLAKIYTWHWVVRKQAVTSQCCLSIKLTMMP